MKRVFIIHGWDGSPEGWIAWLKDELQKKGYEAVAPQMPNAGEPKMEEWIPFLSDLVGEPDENTYFVGHSMGTQTIMRYLESIYPRKVGQVVLVAGFFHLTNLEDAESEAVAKPWLETPIDFEKIKAVAGSITVFMSDNDEWVPILDAEIFKEKLGAEVEIKHSKGHFENEAEMPEILEKIEKSPW